MKKLYLILALGVSLLAGSLPARAAEVAVLRNGFTINFDHKEVRGEITRLYLTGGFVDVPSVEIASFEAAPDEPVDVPAAQPVPPNNLANNAVVNSTGQPVPDSQSIASNPSVNGADLDQVVREASNRYRLDPDFVNSVIKAESNFQIHAVSPKGAQGLMQLMPQTATQLGVSNPFDPKANVEAGTAYLSYLLDLYHDDAVKALAAYNAGSRRVDQYHGVPPYMETREYVAKIVRDFNAKKLAQRKSAAGATNASASRSPSSTQKPATKKKTKRSQPQQAVVSKPQKPA